MKGFKNANVYLENVGVVKTDVKVSNGIIESVGENLSIDSPFPVKDNQIVVAGFIDQHIHGAGGADAMDGTIEALETIATKIACEGTTSFLATTMTQSEQNILNALSAVNDYIKSEKENGARLLGVHLEGPFISKKHIGAQPLEHVAEPSVEIFKKYQVASGNNVKIVSLAPEEEGAEQLIKYLSLNSIVPSAGHTDAGFNELEKATEWGLKNITHTFNAQRGVHHREIGTAGFGLLSDKVNCEAICDTIHLSIPAIKLLIKNKPHDKFTLITDSMRAKHLSDGISELGGQKVIVKNGEARLENGALAGSILKMNDAIKNLVEKCGVKFTDAIDFATVNPAKNLGVFDKVGSIREGKFADFTVLNPDFSVSLTVRGGKIVYQA